MDFFQKAIYAVTIDFDWAPDALIEDTSALLGRYGVSATFFATHKHGAVIPARHEIGVHPKMLENFLEGTPPETVLRDIMALYPSARGVRNHSLCACTRFYRLYTPHGLQYESNMLCYGVHHLRPFWMVEGVVQLPLFWEDDLHMDYAARLGHRMFSLQPLQLERPGLKVFNFHPVHLWLNTESAAHYLAAKQYYHEPHELERFRNTERPGVRTMFVQLLEWLANDRLESTHRLVDIAEHWRKEQRGP